MTTKEHITITPTRNNIQFDIKQGNQSRWFSVDMEIAKELYQRLGDVLGEQQEYKELDWIDREIALVELLGLDHDTSTFVSRKNVERDYERQHVPKIVKEGLE